jgi:parvulin-like peptidyl-prolyl isomerase
MKPRTLAVALASLAVVTTAPAEIVERVIVKVNGDIVTQSEFEARQVAAVQAARIAPDRIENFLRQNNARILQEAIDDLLVLQRAADLGMRMPPAYLKEVIENIKKENNIANEEEFQRQLRREGMTLEDLKRNIERQVLRRQVLQKELEPKVAMSDNDARAEYEARKAEYTKQATVHLQEIVVTGDDPRALARAQEVVKRLRAGEDFATVAREVSASPTRAAGGDLGTISRGEMNAELEKVAFALPAGAVSDPFVSADGYRILHVAEKTEGTVVPFDQVKADIMKRLSQDRWQKEYDRYVEELRKTAMIDVRVREVPLQVTVPPNASSLLEPPAPEGPSEAAAPKPAPDSGPAPEFSTTPQERPERVGPATLPGEEQPKAKPTPSPRPTPTPQPH